MGMEVLVSNAVMGTEVRVSGAGMGAVVPVRAAGTITSTLSEADIAIIVDRVTRNLQLPAAGGRVGRHYQPAPIIDRIRTSRYECAYACAYACAHDLRSSMCNHEALLQGSR